MHFSLSASLLGTVALMISSVHGQDAPVNAPVAVPPPLATDSVKVTYANDGNGVIAEETVPFNTCFASETAFAKYSYINLTPGNATMNFYKDSNCQEFTFGLDGYYGGYPGPARSFRWVGWDVAHRGDLFNKDPILGQGDASNGHVDPPTTGAPVTGGKAVPDASKEESGSSSSSTSTFFGGVFGSLVILSIGGVIFWKTAGKKMTQDKGKGVLPYNRVGGQRDGDILLTTNNRSHNSFEIGEEEDEEEDEDNRRQRAGHQQRYRDDDV
ncbi:hypothetical protein BG006_009898 [Podila minutissima]|uniref:Uncharacterized protein n=1 Tax=Podila minutissima TaxID=64525 RepID=A0A9P5SDY7_9FUNG|nr:hypothetical protein BG006_009898 [Podila minutissima]